MEASLTCNRINIAAVVEPCYETPSFESMVARNSTRFQVIL